ncbi:hypothetical protein EGW08_003550 [Elysia chlorotica]|uniref:Uncharacterized protein n=1 Tax=Elysia chlorotica TaxID=188477 RepID=A0A3S1HYN2_ELYCH|nr:hypothetical protein EGW08_003550 [Elysia chlorotica]
MLAGLLQVEAKLLQRSGHSILSMSRWICAPGVLSTIHVEPQAARVKVNTAKFVMAHITFYQKVNMAKFVMAHITFYQKVNMAKFVMAHITFYQKVNMAKFVMAHITFYQKVNMAKFVMAHITFCQKVNMAKFDSQNRLNIDPCDGSSSLKQAKAEMKAERSHPVKAEMKAERSYSVKAEMKAERSYPVKAGQYGKKKRIIGSKAHGNDLFKGLLTEKSTEGV